MKNIDNIFLLQISIKKYRNYLYFIKLYILYYADIIFLNKKNEII